MKRIIYLGIAVLVVVLVWTGGWFYIAGEIRKNIELMADADGTTAPMLSCGTLDISGYPFHFNADCENASLLSGDVLTTIPGLRVSAQVYQPTHLLASALGPVTISDNFTGSRSDVNWDGLQASLRLEGWRIARLSIIADNLVWTDKLFGQPIASAPKAEFHLIDIPEQYDAERGTAALALYTEAHDIAAPGLTIADGTASIQAELSGLPDDIRLLGNPDLLRQMQQAGGTLKLIDITASDTETSKLSASGELSLDPQGLLNGNIDIISTGVVERVGPLLEEPFRTLTFGNAGPDGSYTQKLSARSGGIFSGLVPISSVPPLF
ncbi:DUF2125 domain-containing protein [Devosia rhodophyticola]|uniref:DUF2125 domain-containing protein n=1 Tax=Devosia rhodophyticola TaxID=3026423 RepID=A0ABY7YU88_9HYPH|nr:DUF2125 domain-containing protein [Devosia rhodophyticola]WDR04615.1 DUF2125 domain-containing protein [Devosia rhodophyticola]